MLGCQVMDKKLLCIWSVLIFEIALTHATNQSSQILLKFFISRMTAKLWFCDHESTSKSGQEIGFTLHGSILFMYIYLQTIFTIFALRLQICPISTKYLFDSILIGCFFKHEYKTLALHKLYDHKTSGAHQYT